MSKLPQESEQTKTNADDLSNANISGHIVDNNQRIKINETHQLPEGLVVNQEKSVNSSAVKSSNLPKYLKLLVIIPIFFIIICSLILMYHTLSTPIEQKKQMLTIEKGDTYYKLIDRWEKKQKWFFTPFAKLYIKTQTDKPLYAGSYQIPENPTFKQLIDILQQGEKVALVKIQIIEGKTAKDLYKILNNLPTIKKEIINAETLQIDAKRLQLPLSPQEMPHDNLEGWFSPDTYYYNEGMTDKRILTDLFNRQHQALMDNWQNRQANLPYKTPYEALIMASIIEKETSMPAERQEVAGVFVNRLRKGMRLQTDPTVIYGMGERYDGNIRKKDLLEKTPYNTYQIDGLPPTPIALPSIASIHAALHPNKTDSLYFVATGKGGHKFSSNLDDHNKAVQDYLKVIREQKAQSN